MTPGHPAASGPRPTATAGSPEGGRPSRAARGLPSSRLAAVPPCRRRIFPRRRRRRRVASRPCEPNRRDAGARPARRRLPMAARVVVDLATSATASRSPPARCWSPRSPRTRGSSRSPRPLQWLPPLLFGLFAGALSDRLDRRRIVVTVDVVRVVVLAVLTATIADRRRVHRASCSAALFLLGTAEVFADNTSHDAAADARGARRPRGGELPAADRVHHRQPARRAAAGCRAVRRRARCWPFASAGARRRGSAPCSSPGSSCRRTGARARRAHAHPARHRRGLPLGARTTRPCGRSS